MDAPLSISLVIPVFNAQHSLAKCLDSILKQDYNGYEIILVNDGSSDGSQGLIEQYAGRYPDIVKFTRQENLGVGIARNAGIAMARGIYLGFVDSDDFLEPNYFTTVASIISTQQPDLIVISYHRVYKRKPGFLEKRYRFGRNKSTGSHINIDSHPQLICQAENGVCLKIIRRDIVCNDQDALFSTVMLGEDLEASLKWYLKARKITFTQEKIYNYVIHAGSLNTSTRHITDFFRVIQSVCGAYQLHGKFESCHAELEIVFTKHLLISNLRRIKSAQMENKYALFLALRKELIQYFPDFHKNIYLKREPFYVKLAVFLSWHIPVFFRFIL